MWLSLSRMRRGLDGKGVLEQDMAKLKEDEWPRPVMLHLLGRMDREALVAAATREVDEKVRNERVCEANYYIAARLIAAGERAPARPLLEKARAGCPPNFIEYDAAVAELEKAK